MTFETEIVPAKSLVIGDRVAMFGKRWFCLRVKVGWFRVRVLLHSFDGDELNLTFSRWHLILKFWRVK